MVDLNDIASMQAGEFLPPSKDLVYIECHTNRSGKKCWSIWLGSSWPIATSLTNVAAVAHRYNDALKKWGERAAS